MRVPPQIFLIFTFSESPLLGGLYGAGIGAGIQNKTCVPFCSSVGGREGGQSKR